MDSFGSGWSAFVNADINLRDKQNGQNFAKNLELLVSQRLCSTVFI
jgi:hypothetical protein